MLSIPSIQSTSFSHVRTPLRGTATETSFSMAGTTSHRAKPLNPFHISENPAPAARPPLAKPCHFASYFRKPPGLRRERPSRKSCHFVRYFRKPRPCGETAPRETLPFRLIFPKTPRPAARAPLTKNLPFRPIFPKTPPLRRERPSRNPAISPHISENPPTYSRPLHAVCCIIFAIPPLLPS